MMEVSLKALLGLIAVVFLLLSGTAMAGPVEISGGLDITGTPGTDGVTFPDSTTQTTAINGSLYQKRVTGTCSSGYAISSIDSTGAVVGCQSMGSGSVTSVDTGTGLTGGPITTTGTISILTGGVTDSMLASGISGSKITGNISGSAASITGNITESQVTNLTTDLSNKAASGANSDITSLSGLTTPLSISQGGTGSSTQNFVDLTTDQTIGGNKTFNSPITSTVAIGTSPLQVVSTTMVNNFNAEMIGGKKLADLDSRYISGPAPSRAPKTNAITTLDSAGDVGRNISMTIGTDALPIISYNDYTNGYLKVAHCVDAQCSSADIYALDSTGSAASTSITIGVDGLPIISYRDITNGHLKAAHCSNIQCSSAGTYIVDSSATVGQFCTITIGTDGLPIISYYDGANHDLKVAHCADVQCSSAAVNALDSTGDVGQFGSITIGTDGLPIISYLDLTNANLKVARCDDVQCSSASAYTLDSTGPAPGSNTSIAIGSDGLPIISYFDSANLDLKVVHCTNASCSSYDVPRALDSAGDVGKNLSMTIGTDGFPIISYYDHTNGDLKIIHCTNASCSTNDAPRTLDSTEDVGWFTSITIGTDGFPIVSYYDFTNKDLKVLKCANQYCINNWTRR